MLEALHSRYGLPMSCMAHTRTRLPCSQARSSRARSQGKVRDACTLICCLGLMGQQILQLALEDIVQRRRHKLSLVQHDVRVRKQALAS